MSENFDRIQDSRLDEDVLDVLLELDAQATRDWKVERGNAGSEHPLFLSTGGRGGWRLGSDENTAIAAAARNSIRSLAEEVKRRRAVDADVLELIAECRDHLYEKQDMNRVRQMARRLTENISNPAPITAPRVADTCDPVRQLLKAAKDLADALETCHICSGTLLVEDGPTYCSEGGCSSDCEDHDGSECRPISQIHANLKLAIKAIESENPPVVDPATTQAVRADPIRDELLAALKLHHEWHLEIGTVYELDREGDPIQLDLTDAYSDSGLCESTLNAIARAGSPAPAQPTRHEFSAAVLEMACDSCRGTGKRIVPGCRLAQETK